MQKYMKIPVFMGTVAEGMVAFFGDKTPENGHINSCTIYNL